MEGANDDQANDYDKTFLEDPAILDKYKAAADVSESKYSQLYKKWNFWSCNLVMINDTLCNYN